jgi:hypothetical protein
MAEALVRSQASRYGGTPAVFLVLHVSPAPMPHTLIQSLSPTLISETDSLDE